MGSYPVAAARGRNGGVLSYVKKIKRLFGANLIAYWPLMETAGAVAFDVSGNGRNGAYTAVGLANVAGPPVPGNPGRAPLFDGVNSFVNIYSAGLAAAFNGQEGSFMIWLRDTTGSDGVLRRWLALFSGANNFIYGARTAAGNNYQADYRANTTPEQQSWVVAPSVNWFHVAVTWSFTGDAVNYYLNSVAGPTDIGLGAWAGALNATQTVIGASSTIPANVYAGWESHCLLLNRPATPVEVGKVYTGIF